MKPALLRSVPIVFVLGTVLAGWPGSQAWAETKYFPVPVAATSKNDGNDFGFVVPTLITEPDGELSHLVAPMFVVNTYVGAQGTINLFRYQPGGRQTRFIASLSQKVERKLLFNYTDPALSHGRYALNVGATFFKNATRRFYGIGNTTPLSNQTNYTGREIRANWTFGVHMNEVTQIAVGQRYRDMTIQPGVVTRFPFAATMFPTVAGMQGATILGHRITFHYDTRDNLVTPTDGTQITAYAELNQNFRNSANPVYYRYEVELKKLIPTESKRSILVLRADLQATIGKQVPFYELSSLGGQNNLRGYGVDRFIDNNLIVFNIEQRIHVFRTRIKNVVTEFEVAPFVDMGKVFSTFRRQTFENYKITPGIGFRALVRPNVVGRVDYGYSHEGGAVFAGLDFPF